MHRTRRIYPVNVRHEIELHSHGGTLDPRTGEAIYDGGRE